MLPVHPIAAGGKLLAIGLLLAIAIVANVVWTIAISPVDIARAIAAPAARHGAQA